jgi:hypothetical protein
MFTLNSHKISAIDWNPIEFNVIGGQFDLIKHPVTFSNGMKFIVYPFFNNITDFSFNNKTGIFLTEPNNISNLLKDKNLPSDKNDLKTLTTYIADITNDPYKPYSIRGSLSGLKISTESKFDAMDQLTFNFVDNQVYIENYFGQVLTQAGTGDGQLHFGPKTLPLNEYQLWDYVLGNSIILLFASNTNYSQILLKNAYDHLELNTYNLDLSALIPNNAYIRLISFAQKDRNYNSVLDSQIVKYNASPIINEGDLTVIKDDNIYLENNLGIMPYEYENEDGTYNFYLHPLKNYQTSEYSYSTPEHNRFYYKIYSGTNQEKGLNRVYLGYQTDTILVDFPPNQEKAFYFSTTTDAIYLSASGFIESGASAGNYPYTSDRLFTSKTTNFAEIKGLENILSLTDTKENRFLCSWLYGNKTTGEKIWYDRYFNPAYYSLDQALSATHLTYNPSIDNTKELVYDIPSETILSPGVYYKYYHVGNEDSLNYLKDLNFKYDNGLKYTNLLNVSSWSSKVLNDESSYNNHGLTFGNSGNFFGDYWTMDGSNYAIFQANDNLLESKNLTTSIWFNVEDWANVNGYQLFGNYYNSGFGLINDAATIAPLMTIINNDSSSFYNFNYRFGEVSNSKTPLTGADIVQRLSDLSYWLFDSVNLKAIKYNVDNSIISFDKNGIAGPIDIPTLSIIDQVETDKNENMYLYDNENKSYIIMSKNGNFSYGGKFNDDSVNRIEIDQYNYVYPVYGNCSVIDNNSNLWEVIGPNLYKNKNLIATVGASNQISCDNYNNIWITSDDDSYTKLDANGNIVFRRQFSKISLPPSDDCDPAPDEKPPLLQVLEEDLPFLSTLDKKYILTLPPYDQILVSPPEPHPIKPPAKITQRTRAINFISYPVPIKNNTELVSVCGLSAVQYDQMVMVDLIDNQAYIINQMGQLVSKINLEVLLKQGETAKFKTGGDFTGYQNIRKFQKTSETTFSWKFQTIPPSSTNSLSSSSTHTLSANVSRLPKGWHNFTFTFDGFNGFAKYYIDSVEVGVVSFPRYNEIFYDYRTSLILGAKTIKNTILNNLLDLSEGYRFIGSVGDLKMYNIALDHGDVEQLYYSSPFAPKIRSLKWNMPVGYRNYVEEITEWFQFQMPTNKSKYYNINIHNLNVDNNIKNNIELAISKIIGKLSPAYTVLNKINWK